MTKATKRVIIVAVAFVVMAAIVLGMVAALVSGGTDGNKVTENGGMIMGESDGNGVALTSSVIAPEDYAAYGVSALAESAYTVTATIEPATATNKTVDWSVSWANAESEFATGKTVTDYVTVTPESDGALTATVECLRAFGEQIEIIVESRQNTAITATCTVDYYKRVSAIDASISNVDLSSGSDIPFTTGMNFTAKPTYSDGTLEDSYTHTAKVKFTSSFEDYLENYTDNYIGGMKIRDFFGVGYTTEYTLIYGTISYTFFESLCYSDSGGSYTIDDDPYFIDIFYSALKEYSGDVFTFILTSTGTSSGITKQQLYDVGVNTSVISINVANIELDEVGIVF